MSKNQLFTITFKLASIIAIASIISAYPIQLQAQVNRPVTSGEVNSLNMRLGTVKFPDNGAPKGRRRGGTARGPGGDCPALSTPITAMVPGQDTFSQTKKRTEFKSFTAATTSDFPTFWVYLPQLPSNLRNGEFILQDEQGEEVYKTTVTLLQQPGIIGISLPNQPQYALKINSKYNWYFKLPCGDTKKSEYFYVDAWVERVNKSRDLERRLNNVRVAPYIAYAQNQVWYDAFTDLAQLRQTNSNSSALEADWQILLKSVGLEKLASATVVQVDTLAK